MRIFFSLLAFVWCSLGDHTYAKESVADSLYDLPIRFVDQQGREQALDLHRGHAVIVTLFYGSCPNACPLLIESIRATENVLTERARESVRILMISIDPERDTPVALAKLASTRRLDTRRWTLASMTDDDVRIVAAALGVKYRKAPSGEYNHTSILTLLSPAGAIDKQTALLGKGDRSFIDAVERMAVQGSAR